MKKQLKLVVEFSDGHEDERFMVTEQSFETGTLRKMWAKEKFDANPKILRIMALNLYHAEHSSEPSVDSACMFVLFERKEGGK